MHTITIKRKLAPNVTWIDVEAPEVARRAQPGQFVIIRINERGERIPLTIAGKDAGRGTITLIFQELGKTTALLGTLDEGDALLDLLGPLGHPTEIRRIGTIAAVAGGVGVAEVLAVAGAFRDAGNKVIGIIGARSREFLILEREMEQATDQLYVATDDGSAGRQGFVTDVLNELVAKQVHIDLVYAIGPVPMMKAVAALTRTPAIPTLVSLNPIMVDGTGMCGACRVTVGGRTRFACVEGPEFDAHQVDWDELTARLTLFRKEEKVCLEKHIEECRWKNANK